MDCPRRTEKQFATSGIRACPFGTGKVFTIFSDRAEKQQSRPGAACRLVTALPTNSGAGEGIRTLDPDLGKITVNGAEK
jgi:hypothetical protein